MRAFGFPVGGNGYNAVQRRVQRAGLDTAHWRRNKPFEPRPLAERYVPGAFITNRPRAKRQLIGAGLIENACALCGMGPEWRGQELVLVLDHVNGVADDWRPDNLRMLCPNCNAQQPTFCGRNARRGRHKDTAFRT